MFDEYEDIALSDEKNINHITLDKYVGRNDCKTEVNLESVDKKPNFLFFSRAAVLDTQNRYHHKMY